MVGAVRSSDEVSVAFWMIPVDDGLDFAQSTKGGVSSSSTTSKGALLSKST
jgi:hypothetical protein